MTLRVDQLSAGRHDLQMSDALADVTGGGPPLSADDYSSPQVS